MCFPPCFICPYDTFISPSASVSCPLFSGLGSGYMVGGDGHSLCPLIPSFPSDETSGITAPGLVVVLARTFVNVSEHIHTSVFFLFLTQYSRRTVSGFIVILSLVTTLDRVHVE